MPIVIVEYFRQSCRLCSKLLHYAALCAIFLESQKPALNFCRARAGLGFPKYKETIQIKGDYFYGKACD